MSEKNEILRYCIAFGKAYERFLKRVEDGDVAYRNEQEVRCHLFAEYIKYLRQHDFPKPHHIFVDYKINDKIVDMAIPIINEDRVIAIEIKYDPSLSGIEEDLAKLSELINKNLALRGIFITLALSEYKLKERLNEREIFQKFGLKEKGEGYSGFVEWQTLRRPYDSKLVDALYIVLWKAKTNIRGIRCPFQELGVKN